MMSFLKMYLWFGKTQNQVRVVELSFVFYIDTTIYYNTYIGKN